ncbi:eukaryotic rRNA processing protein EBP2 [Dictyocaulus viviparus]|uniref:Eukaryotic rRNA processing protein EBP2 n=1 Tax=Dictyocaulus viviparus TaxID=29172 RepID=A0A0D8XT60_DICVI|nr:eukaryotic rRNA processing protein EBP2 [Dictyocaulus viviparus]
MGSKSRRVRKVSMERSAGFGTESSTLKEYELDSIGVDDFSKFKDENQNQKPLLTGTYFEDDFEDEDSDKELQIALREGLIKSDQLNYIALKKRPIIKKCAEIREKIAEFAEKLPWIETLDITTKSELTKEMINSDFDREMQLVLHECCSYHQAEKAVQLAVPRLLSLGVKVIRPSDYYAEMAKSDGHMQKVRQRLLTIQKGKERQEALRKIREEKKYAAMVKKELLEKRSNEKKLLLDAVKKHRKGMKQQLEEMLNNAKKMGLNQADDTVDSSLKNTLKKSYGKKNARSFDVKKWKNEKFGYGGKKKGSKRNNKERIRLDGRFYQINGPFLMDSQFEAMKRKTRRERKKTKLNTTLVEYSEEIATLERLARRIREAGLSVGLFSTQVHHDNNRVARNAVQELMEKRFHMYRPQAIITNEIVVVEDNR